MIHVNLHSQLGRPPAAMNSCSVLSGGEEPRRWADPQLRLCSHQCELSRFCFPYHWQLGSARARNTFYEPWAQRSGFDYRVNVLNSMTRRKAYHTPARRFLFPCDSCAQIVTAPVATDTAASHLGPSRILQACWFFCKRPWTTVRAVAHR